ncbi:transmembrane protease serine 11D-like [Ischnura elegans]|uniref:transmembrane protease serine 11D-like n=1 Tax=Ischnura elegans TaxID=197161 RepID=UPI001ED89B8F|nr:transmembrane protease serine 11D-like [Ischnura elegans]
MASKVIVSLLLLGVTASWAAVWSARPSTQDRRPALIFPSDIEHLLDLPTRPVSHGSATCKCGRTHVDRIVGGTTAKSGHWCWQAKVMVWSDDDDGSFFLCGGSVINDEYVLSAAHCFHGHEGSKVDIHLGAHKLFYDTVGTKYGVDSIQIHADYDPVSKANDIALVKLNKKIKFTDRVCSVCLPSQEDYTGETCTITGWGALKSGGDSPSELMQTEVKVIPFDTCKQEYGRLDESQICAAAPGRDSCQGDSGGPMVHQGKNGIWELVGVVSAGKGCADPDYAGLYANVHAFLPWIKQHTKGAQYCSR